MSRAVVFRTPGLVPIESFTTFGINAKPNSQNPIGRFGTGLKYAISVLVRLGCNPVVWIGREKYIFSVKSQDFRGKSFDFIQMRREKYDVFGTLKGRPNVTKLPYTTEYGKDWEVWQAFRELESNTRDENGETYAIDNAEVYGDHYAEDNQTLIIIQDEKFLEVFHEMDKIFLPEGLTQRECSSNSEVLERSSKFLYFRGLRVADLPKPSLFTYNIVADVSLTEDRTAKYDWEVREHVSKTVARSHDRNFIETVLTANKEAWEHGLSFDDLGFEPTEEFKEVVRRRRGAVGRSAYGYGSFYGGGGGYVSTFSKYQLPWKISYDSITDKIGNIVLSKPYGLPDYEWKRLAQEVIDIVNEAKGAQHEPSPEPVEEPAPEIPDISNDVEATPDSEDDIPF